MTRELLGLHCLDPLYGLPSLAERSIDHVITDPPYSKHVVEKSKRGTKAKPAGRDLAFSSIDHFAIFQVAHYFAKVAKRWVAVFTDPEQAHVWREALAANGMEYVRTMAWLHGNSAPQFSGDRPAHGFEEIVLAHQRKEGGANLKKRWNGGGRQGIYSFPIVARGERLHTTQKPLALMEALVRDFTEPGELVLDPFVGCGTTAVACARLGRGYVAYEKDAHWFKVAERRLRLTREQLQLPLEPRRRARQEALAI